MLLNIKHDTDGTDWLWKGFYAECMGNRANVEHLVTLDLRLSLRWISLLSFENTRAGR